jgi:DNA-directed RNA polymerase subunit RPC12/RpoP
MIQFTCEHCGERVRRGRHDRAARNHCPACLWSKHTEHGGQVDRPPCGGMMKPARVGDEEVVWRCLDCGLTVRGFTDDYLFRNLAAGLDNAIPMTFYAGDS